nr:MAG TPA: hypothetical protein [Caudoviricetes sp.]
MLKTINTKVDDIPVRTNWTWTKNNSQEGLLLSYSDWRNYEEIEFKRCYI